MIERLKQRPSVQRIGDTFSDVGTVLIDVKEEIKAIAIREDYHKSLGKSSDEGLVFLEGLHRDGVLAGGLISFWGGFGVGVGISLEKVLDESKSARVISQGVKALGLASMVLGVLSGAKNVQSMSWIEEEKVRRKGRNQNV